MNVRIVVLGGKSVTDMFKKKALMHNDFDKLAEHSMKRIQMGAFKKAPVLTGYLSSNLLADENRVRTPGMSKGSWDLIDGTDYTLVQEYEHSSKKGFIRNSVWDERPKFYKAVDKLAKDKKWRL